MADKSSRPTSSHSSERDGVSRTLGPAEVPARNTCSSTDVHSAMQDSFEDAPENTPRPDSHSEQARSRSLISKRQSSSSASHDSRADSTASGESEMSSKANDDAEKLGEGAPAAKSPLLTGHRISVTSDMDDVALDEGKCIYRWTGPNAV